jgi:hypothetical protein
MFNKVGDFMQSKAENNESRAVRRENARKAYKMAKRMRKDLENDPEFAAKIRSGAETIKKPIE